jgi:hypothetical protein
MGKRLIAGSNQTIQPEHTRELSAKPEPAFPAFWYSDTVILQKYNLILNEVADRC